MLKLFCLLDNLSTQSAIAFRVYTVDNTGMVTPVNVKRFQYAENTVGQAQPVLLCSPEIASRRGELNNYLFFIVLSTFF